MQDIVRPIEEIAEDFSAHRSCSLVELLRLYHHSQMETLLSNTEQFRLYTLVKQTPAVLHPNALALNYRASVYRQRDPGRN
jgi:hypothetical protein